MSKKKLSLERFSKEQLQTLANDQLYKIQGGASTTTGSSGSTTTTNAHKLGYTYSAYTSYGGYSTYEPGAGGMSDIGGSYPYDILEEKDEATPW